MKWLTQIWMTGLSRRTMVFWCLAVGLLGMLLVSSRLGMGLAAWSFDLPFWFAPQTDRHDHIVLVSIDDPVDGGPSPVTDRNKQATLIDRLTKAGAKLIFLDLIHLGNGPPEADQRLIETMQEASHVVLAAGFRVMITDDGIKRESILPLPKFREAAHGFGFASLGQENSLNLGRKIYSDPNKTNVNDVVANILNIGPRPDTERWIRYYGKPEDVFPSFRFDEITATNQSSLNIENVSGKIVYVGMNRIILDETESPEGRDRFPTPYSRFGGAYSPGFAIHANVLENLLSNDWIVRAPIWLEVIGVLFLGAGFTALFLHLRIDVALVAALLLMVTLSLASFALILGGGLWISWLVPVACQIPMGCVAAAVVQIRTPRRVRKPFDAFLSYRREGGSETARLLQRELAQKKIRAFLDVVELGANEFGPQLLQALADAPNFVIILTPGTLDRCQDEKDWVRQEICEALKAGANIVPVFKDGFTFPPKEDLPEAIRRMTDFNGITYSHELFDSTLNKLVQFLK